MTTNLLKEKSAPAAAFTGHRNIAHAQYPQIKGQLKIAIYNSYLQSIRKFYCGCAVGFDLLAAEAVLEMKGQLHDITLSAVVPYRNQCEWFSSSARQRYHDVLEKADDVMILGEEYHARCFLERNDYMVERSSLLIAYFYGNHKGGTFYTCHKAASRGLPINNLYTA